jgi:hypothetical protein
MDRQHDGRQPKADMQQLDDALNMLADSLMPTPGGWVGGRAGWERAKRGGAGHFIGWLAGSAFAGAGAAASTHHSLPGLVSNNWFSLPPCCLAAPPPPAFLQRSRPR